MQCMKRATKCNPRMNYDRVSEVKLNEKADRFVRHDTIGRDEVFSNWDVPHRAISLCGWHTYEKTWIENKHKQL